MFLFVYLLLFSVREGGKVYNWRNSGGANSEVEIKGGKDSLLVFSEVDTTDFQFKPYPIKGDTILSVEDINAHLLSGWDNHFNSPNAAGIESKLEYTHDGKPAKNVLRTSYPKQTEFVLIVILQVLRFIIAFLFVGVGLWAFLKRPDSRPVRALAMFCFVMTGFMITGVTAISQRFALFEVPLNSLIHEFLNSMSVLAGAYWLNLAMLFPSPTKFMREKPFWAYAIIYSPYLLFLPLIFVADFADYLDVRIIRVGILLILALQIGAGFWILSYRQKRLVDKLEQDEDVQKVYHNLR